MKKIVHDIGLDVHKETIGGWPGPEGLVASEPIYSLRSPGGAGK